MKIRKTPTRICVGCGETKNKRDLIRVVKNKESEVFLDKTGKANGRGAYICDDINCLEKSFKNRGLERSLKTSISEELRSELKKAIESE
ncbi:MAG: YlxR family protein [Tissierellia bacterium]|nr:YlxR family protein [Tissierellia bacterium]